LLGSRLQQWNLLASGTKISMYRERHGKMFWGSQLVQEPVRHPVT
jgi:hypothetical protein